MFYVSKCVIEVLLCFPLQNFLLDVLHIKIKGNNFAPRTHEDAANSKTYIPNVVINNKY